MNGLQIFIGCIFLGSTYLIFRIFIWSIVENNILEEKGNWLLPVIAAVALPILCITDFCLIWSFTATGSISEAYAAIFFWRDPPLGETRFASMISWFQLLLFAITTTVVLFRLAKESTEFYVNAKISTAEYRTAQREEMRAQAEGRKPPKPTKTFKKMYLEQLAARLLARITVVVGSAALALFFGLDHTVVLWSASIAGILTLSLTILT